MRRALIVIAVVVAALAALAWTRPAAVEALLVLEDLASGPLPSFLKTVTPRPERRAVSFAGGSGDLYLPGETAGAGIVLVPGAAREGKDDPRLVALATTLARARFVVLVPDIASLRELAVSADDRRPIADAARYLAGERGKDRVGVAAISYAVAPAVLAALDEPGIDFVVGIGGVYDLEAVVTFFTTGYYRVSPGQDWRTMRPNAYGKWVFIAANAGRMEDSADRALLAAIAERKMADPGAAIDDLRTGLSPQGQAVMALLDNDDPARVPTLIRALPPAIEGEIRRMDLAETDLSRLHARLILVHGRDDRIIPWTESAALAAMAPHAKLVLLDNLAHADLRPGGAMDAAALWCAVRRLLEERG
ncbi:MAG: alpha/beta hydrolase [Pseudomonadota bacterium]